jgi:isoamylase
MLNASWEPLHFEVPPPVQEGRTWLRWIDTALASPEEIVAWEKAPAVAEDRYRVQLRSMVFLVAPAATGDEA